MQITDQNPFPGLRSFDYEESHLFFGREKHISDLLRKLTQNHFVAIVGTSGSGKSSLVRAGLLPAIQKGQLSTDGTEWIITTLKPGNTAVKNLAQSLIKKNVFATGDPVKDEAQVIHIENLLSANSLGLVQAARNLLPAKKNLLILLDQFEETFRFKGEGMEHNDADSSMFVNLIIDAVRQRDIPIYVVLTIRSDFLGDCARFEGLPEAINDGHYLVPRLTTEQNKKVITGPVNYANGKISPRLIQQVLNDLGDNPDQLPVLQHALMRTWDVWKKTAETGEPMDIRHYELIGGMEHALSNHADEAYNELKTDSQKKLIENIFKCLTVKTGESRGVRRPTSIKQLMEITGTSFEEVKEALYPFRISGRTFILPAEDVPVSENSVMDISHESLMRAWDRLKNWVDEESESAAIYLRLCESAILNKEGKAALWRNPELQMALDWNAKSNPNSGWARQYNEQFSEAIKFLEASRTEDIAEKARLNKRRMLIRASVITFLVIVSILSGWALLQTKKANEKSVLAEQKTVEALNQKQLAEQSKEMALDASRKALDAKSFAELQSNIAGQQTKLAEQQKLKAEEEALRATTQEQEALKQKQLAEEKRLEALNQKQKADSSQSEATRLRLISISQNIAFKSIQQKDDPQLAALLANQSYKMAKENGGNLNDPQLYNAVYFAAQKIDPSFKPVVIREIDEASVINASGKNISVLLANGQLKNYSTSNYEAAQNVKLSGLTAALNTTYISENGKYTAVGMENNAALVYDLSEPDKPHSLPGHSGLIRAVVFSDDGSPIATGGRDSTVLIWKNFANPKKIKFNARIKSLSFNNDFTKLFVGCEDGTISLCTLGNDDKQAFASINGARVQCLQCSPSGKYIFAGYSNGVVQVLGNKGNIIRILNEPGSVDYISLDEKNDLLVIGTSTKLLHIYRLSDLSSKPIEINCNSSINAIAINNGEFIYAACSDKTIRMYPLKTSWFEKIFASKITRDFTKDEWNTFVGEDVPHKK